MRVAAECCGKIKLTHIAASITISKYEQKRCSSSRPKIHIHTRTAKPNYGVRNCQQMIQITVWHMRNALMDSLKLLIYSENEYFERKKTDA